MQTTLASLAIAATVFVASIAGGVTNAQAEGAGDTSWLEGRFNASRSYEPRQRSARAERRVETSYENDRPQRRSSGSTFRESLTGGGETGIASYYWQPQRLAGGGWFNPNALTAAHKTLPLGTRVRVTRRDTGQSVDVTINDRGPYIQGRVIDLSRRAAEEVNMTGRGLAPVSVQVIGRS